MTKPLDESLAALERAILHDARDEAQKAQDEAAQKAEAIRNQAREEAEAERRGILEQARRDAERIRGQVIASAELKARTLQLETRERLLERVFAAARGRLADLRKRPDYRTVVLNLLEEALRQLKAGKVQVRADAETLKLLKDGALDDLAKSLQVQASVGQPLDTGLGVIVDTEDGHLHYDNTLDTRLERIKAGLRASVYQVLMGEKL